MKITLYGVHRYCRFNCAQRDHASLYRACWTVDGALITARNGGLPGGERG